MCGSSRHLFPTHAAGGNRRSLLFGSTTELEAPAELIAKSGYGQHLLEIALR
jgi:hypothetical protein